MATAQEPFPTDLCRQLGIMGDKVGNAVSEREDKDWYRKKVYIYATALAQYSRTEWNTKKMAKYSVQEDPKYKWSTPSTYPSYFAKDLFGSKAVGLSSDSKWYDYVFEGDVVKTDAYWVDFANAYLGGGAFTNGFIQEETMCCETPDLANLAAWQDKDAQGNWRSHLMTRTQAGKENLAAVGCGDPTPIVVKGLHRVLNLDAQTNFAHSGLQDTSFEKIRKIVSDGIFKNSTGETFNLIAAAAPNLNAAPKHSPKDEATVVDLLNTFVAMFALAQKQSEGGKSIVVNTGPIGCGNFGNNDIVVFALQALAAGHVSQKDDEFTLKFWAADRDHVSAATKLVQEVKNKHPKSLLDLVKECVTAFSHL